MQSRFVAIFVLISCLMLSAVSGAADQRWSVERANDWYAQQPWLVGSNFIPSTAINQLEMWQADTFDLPTIDRELGWAQGLGMNTMRVFLHNLLWQQDPAGFLKRMDEFLAVADKHHIRVMFVLLDSVWDPRPYLGKQREPRPHVHNSGWVQAPGADMLKDPSRWDKEIKPYIVGVISHFRDDRRVLIWDLMNEPDNGSVQYKSEEMPNKAEAALQLLRKEWEWARSANPSQPLTSGVWQGDWSEGKLSEMARFQLENSDVITFHCYEPPDVMKARIASLRRFHRPIICTEYMARPLGSTFAAILPLLKEERVGAYNWGFVSGKTQTIYPWDSWEKTYTAEPKLWFHDIFRKDGSPFDPRETGLIRSLTASNDEHKP
ncbi:MAG TPA: 1,4-beta-xylanase [Verrucomicrobiae bacterium]|nr:1,4-beta-xylanase [Verrucomicrobiae bacterium]